jgi:hypothetical protein
LIGAGTIVYLSFDEDLFDAHILSEQRVWPEKVIVVENKRYCGNWICWESTKNSFMVITIALQNTSGGNMNGDN